MEPAVVPTKGSVKNKTVSSCKKVEAGATFAAMRHYLARHCTVQSKTCKHTFLRKLRRSFYPQATRIVHENSEKTVP